VAGSAHVPLAAATSPFESSTRESGGTGWSSGAAHTTLAFGLMYFCILALAKFAMHEPAKFVTHTNTRAQLPR